MVKIVFVNLMDYVRKEYDDIPLGILSLGTVLESNNDYDVEIVDFDNIYSKKKLKYFENYDDNIEQMSDYLLERNPDIISFYTMCNTYNSALSIAKKIKEKNSSIKILFGGPQATLTANETLKSFSYIDAIGLGEGENTIELIIDCIKNEKDFGDAKGVAYVKNGEVINNGLPELIENLNELPMLNFDLIDIDGYKEINVDVGRGCPYSCTFCSTKNFWQRKYRLKSPERIIKEIKILKYDYGIEVFSFSHDLFTANKKKIIDICNIIIKEGLDIKWTCCSRIDTIDEEMMLIMSKAGCKGIFFGIESGSERIQKLLNKNLDLSDIYETIDLLMKYNMEVRLSFIYGFPNELESDVRKTIDMIDKIVTKHNKLKNSVVLHKLAYFPGTELTRLYEKELEISDENNPTMMFSNDFTEEVLNMIKENKSVFPQYYEHKTKLRIELAMLEKFIPLVYLRVKNHFKNTLNLLMRYYDGDILKLFYDYKKNEEDALRKISFYNVNEGENDIFNAFISFNKFVQKHNFGEKSAVIKEFSKFEFDVVKFLYRSKEQEKTFKYNFDVYEMIRAKHITNKEKIVELKFYRYDKKIRVVKAS